jgi:hypothetical protein
MPRKKSIISFILFAYLLLLLIPSAPAEILQEITVKEGDTLWSVSNYYLKNPKRWPEILKYNKLPSSDPNIILPGMKLRVPILLIKEHLRAARLVYILNSVRYRRKEEASWKDAWLDMELYNEDSLRTMQQSIAQVKFPSGESLRVDENSLIILRPEKTREEVDLLSGGVRSSRTKILTNSSIVDPRIEPRGPAPDFKTKIKEDKTTLVEVYEGIVDVTAQGRTVTLTKGFGTEVKFKQPPSLPHVLPPQPKIAAQTSGKDVKASQKALPEARAGEKIVSGSLDIQVASPDIIPTAINKSDKTDRVVEKKKKKSKVIGKIIKRYHLQVSTSITFTHLLIDNIDSLEDKIRLDFRQYSLYDGTYYYRFAYIDEMDFEGAFTTPVRFTIDATPPKIEIFPQTEREDKKFIYIEGRTEKNAVLKIDEKPIPVEEDGRFLTALIPKKGQTRFELVAQDRAGNIAEREIAVNSEGLILEETLEKEKVSIRKKSSKVVAFSLATLTIAVIVGVLVLISL